MAHAVARIETRIKHFMTPPIDMEKNKTEGFKCQAACGAGLRNLGYALNTSAVLRVPRSRAYGTELLTRVELDLLDRESTRSDQRSDRRTIWRGVWRTEVRRDKSHLRHNRVVGRRDIPHDEVE